MFEESERSLCGVKKTYQVYDSFGSKQLSNYNFFYKFCHNKSWSESGSGLNPYLFSNRLDPKQSAKTWLRDRLENRITVKKRKKTKTSNEKNE